MALCKKTERQLEEVYKSRKPYLNAKDCCEEKVWGDIYEKKARQIQ